MAEEIENETEAGEPENENEEKPEDTGGEETEDEE